MRISGAGLLILAVLGVAGMALAEEPTWSDEAEVSFVRTGGNTDVTTLAAKNRLKLPLAERFMASWRLQALYGESDGVRNAESYATELRGDYAWTERLFLFASAGWLRDEFAGIENRYVYTLGSGYKFLVGPRHFLLGEAGVTYTREEDTGNNTDDYPGGRLFLEYGYQFNEENRFTQSVEYLADFDDSDNWLFNTETAVVAAMSSRFAMKTAYVLKYDHQPALGLTTTDTILSVALVANF